MVRVGVSVCIHADAGVFLVRTAPRIIWANARTVPTGNIDEIEKINAGHAVDLVIFTDALMHFEQLYRHPLMYGLYGLPLSCN